MFFFWFTSIKQKYINDYYEWIISIDDRIHFQSIHTRNKRLSAIVLFWLSFYHKNQIVNIGKRFKIIYISNIDKMHKGNSLGYFVFISVSWCLWAEKSLKDNQMTGIIIIDAPIRKPKKTSKCLSIYNINMVNNFQLDDSIN